MIKTYVRLDNQAQAEVIRAAHRMGIPVSSHYHYPALRHGADCTEHLGATNRFGYSRTATALGAAYSDVSRLFGAAKAGRTPTLFSANALLPDCPDLVSDQRIKALFPPWEYRKFKAKADMLATVDRGPLLAMLERNIAQISDMMALGRHVHTGTDAPIDTVAVSLHLNLRAMVHFGISTYETLLTATRHAGDFLGEPIGTIAPGKLADLLLVEGDPLTRIEDAARVQLALVGGISHSWASLIEPIQAMQSAMAPSQVHPPLTGSGDRYFWQSLAYVEDCRTACCAGHTQHLGMA